MKDVRFAKQVLFINSLVPLTLLLWDVYHHRAGANPLEVVTRTTGMLTLVFLFVTLAINPVRKLFGVNWLIKFRRMVGLFAFFYGFLHLMTYVWFDRFFNLKSAARDVVARPFLAVGMTAFFLMIPLAITSTNKMVKRLGGKRWNLLHKLIYLSGIAGALHYWMLVKSATRLPLTFAFVLGLLLAFRLLIKYYGQPGKLASNSIVPRR